MKGIPDDYYPDDLEPVPTISELAKRKLATVIERNGKGEVSIARPTPEGQALINEIMARNAERMRVSHERRNHEGTREGNRDP